MSELEVFKSGHIFFESGLKTKEECLEVLAAHAVELSIGSDKKALLDGFLAREKECTTGFGDGFAIPHTRCDAVKQAGVLVLKNDVGMEWEALDDAPVTIAIALLVPNTEGGTVHMKLLSALSRKLINKEFKEAMRTASDKETVYQLLMSVFEGN